MILEQKVKILYWISAMNKNLLLLIFLFFYCLFFSLQLHSKEIILCSNTIFEEKYNISIDLISIDTLSTFNNKNIKLCFKREKILNNISNELERMLVKHNIRIDSENLGIIYDINNNTLTDNEEFLFPAIRGIEKFKNYSILLTLEKDLKINLIKDIDKLYDIYNRKYVNDNTYNFVNSILDNLQTISIVIKERAFFISSIVLHQISNELNLLNIVLENKKKISNKELKNMKLIDENLKIRTKYFIEKRGKSAITPIVWSEISVCVKTLNSKTKQDVHNLRIFYIQQALWDYRNKYQHSFNKLSSPSQMKLPEASYCIWAGLPNNPTPKSDIKKVKVRNNMNKKKIEVELSID